MTQIQVNINFDQIATLIKEGKFSINSYSEEIGVSSAVLRKAVIEHFGADRLEFRRGKKGGVFFVQTTEN